MIDLLALGAEIRAADAGAAAAARAATNRDRVAPGRGRLAELTEWLAATTAGWPPRPLARARLVVVGDVSPAVAHLAAAADVGTREFSADGVESAYAAGVAAADDEIDRGADLLVLAASEPGLASPVVIALLTGTEPVALLPRGAAATDSAAWIERADELRDARHSAAALRHVPGRLLAELGNPTLAAATGFALRSVARRTPLVLDGPTALAAALLCFDTDPRARQWWQIADTATDPAAGRAVEHLTQRPVLDLECSVGDGVAGLLAVSVLRTAATLTETDLKQVGDD